MTKKELEAELAALRAEVAALRAQVYSKPYTIVTPPAYTPYYTSPSYPTITCSTSTVGVLS